MSKIKPRRAFAKEIFTSFGGIAPGGADEMRNFRILSDGSIEKRCGMEAHFVMENNIRGVWQGTVNSASVCMLVCAKAVFCFQDGVARQIATLGTTYGKVYFFHYRSHLYLADGSLLYVYRTESNQFTEAKGYVPLYGSNWHPTALGEVNEPINLFTNRLRVNYFNSTATTSFKLPFYAASVENVLIDGVPDTGFSFTPSSDRVVTSRAGGTVDIFFTVSASTEHHTRLRVSRLAHCGQIDAREYVLLTTGKAGGRYVYCAANVTEAALLQSREAYADSDPLYFKSDGVLPVGDDDDPVTCFFPNRGRVLAFWRLGGAVITLSPKSDAVECYPLSLGMGCTAFGQALMLEGDPIVINEGGIFRLHANASSPDEFYPIALCEQMPFLQDQTFLTGAISIYDHAHGELWFRDPSDTEGLVWVCHPERKQWYCFDGIPAYSFVNLDGHVGFINEKKVFLFDEELTTDDGAPIVALYKSAFLGFSSPESVKRSLRFTLCGFGAEASLEFESERHSRNFVLFNTGNQEVPVCLDKRTRFGRFRHLRFCLRDTGTTRSRWSRLALYSNL